MRVTQVSAAIRYSKEIGSGAWKSLEIGAQGTVDPREDWHEAEARLYTELRTQWTGNGNGNAGNNGDDANDHQQTPEHYCQEHQAEYKRYSKGDSVWYAHNKPDGKWCREAG